MHTTSPITAFPVRGIITIPQADEIPRVMKLVELAGEGVRNATSVAEKVGFDPRQSSYYREAAEILGFLDTQEAYKLTDLGSLFINSDDTTKYRLMICALLYDPIVGRIMSCLQSRLVKTVSKQEVERLVAHVSDLSGDTVKRRAQTIMAWLKWLQQNFGVIALEGDIARLETQQKMF